ncbi:peptidyl-prolyl cis-trans isomerase SurA [Flavobacteriaceae bacterium MAR_2010_72]|nr:peptidyl-prolyl cis-trans isomerase SurA [Flavobacteriaceae bacterium MAR_2010_72]TVZ60081.1 peptidyl-prolyl cis-trans isomerase SurA [Flavobacteriaceae bacterium MAR_2010_105]
MKFKSVSTLLSLCFYLFSFAQNNSENDILFTVADESVKASEFIRVYNKNLDLVKDESQKDVDAYLNLFVNYQLKVMEAKRLGLDKDPKYLREFDNYKKQLTKNFMSESKVTDALVKEAFERSQQEVKASHILIMIEPSEQDTLEVYNRLLNMRQRVLDEGFENVQKDVHNGTTVFAEDLGYFSAFKMVYDFENVAYTTKVGEVSMPFRTQFGFHIVKVFDKRPSRGEVTVQHIMVSNRQTDSTLVPEERIREIYKKVEQGENFESLAKQFSDDKSTASKGGLLAPFKGGQLTSQEFEDQAFSLNSPGDISQPFRTDYGWHIVKLIQKLGLEPFEDARGELEVKVKRDSRSSLINSALVETLKSKYMVTLNDEVIPYFETLINEDFFRNSWKLPDYLVGNHKVLDIDETQYLYSDFGNYLVGVQRRYFDKPIAAKTLVNNELKTFVESMVLKYHEDHLENENPEFAHVLQEYRDGLLLFDLMEQKVWNAATKDSVGLRTYFEANKNKYLWKDRIEALIISGADKKSIAEAKAHLGKGMNANDIKAKLNINNKQNIIVTQGTLELDNPSLPSNLEVKKGISKIYDYNDAFHVIHVIDVLPSTTKTFEQAKGLVINDFQNKIEKDWIKTLKQQFKVTINQEVLAKVKSQIIK